jgi:hypothetical protein
MFTVVGVYFTFYTYGKPCTIILSIIFYIVCCCTFFSSGFLHPSLEMHLSWTMSRPKEKLLFQIVTFYHYYLC